MFHINGHNMGMFGILPLACLEKEDEELRSIKFIESEFFLVFFMEFS